MKYLKISSEINLPIDAVTQTLAAIGRKGAGKTYLATMIAEQMLDIGSQVIVIDPIGNWYGLRVGADGKSKGKEIFIIGGDHGDVPVVPEAGARIAKLLVDKAISAVLDISSFRLNERKRFCADFGEELLHLKKKSRTPVHVFIEEAQLIIPQRVGPDEARMVGAFEQIVRLGRNYGIGCTLITQRPQSVNKEVLSQVECLCVLQVTGPHERKALEDWVQEVGADRTLVGELPSLAQGEGYIWSPAWLRIFERVHFSKKETFDASATPVVGQEKKAAQLSVIDVEKLKLDMIDVVKKAENDDPRTLHKRIFELEKQLKNRPEIQITGTEYIPLEKPLLKMQDFKKILSAVHRFEKAAPRFETLAKVLNLALQEFNTIGKKLDNTTSEKPFVLDKKRFNAPSVQIAKKTATKPVVYSDGKPLRLGAMKMLAWLAGAGTLSKQRLATLSGFSASGGTFNTYISELKRNGWIIGNDDLSITDEGSEQTEPEAIPSGEELLNLWKSKFREGAAKILQFVFEKVETNKTEVGSATGFEPSGGTFNTYISELRRNGLICVDGDQISISQEFFQ